MYKIIVNEKIVFETDSTIEFVEELVKRRCHLHVLYDLLEDKSKNFKYFTVTIPL